MNAAEKFAQDSLIAQMAATLLAGAMSGGMAPELRHLECHYQNARMAVFQARAIYNAATDARIKWGTQ
jgi:hypothetical protein